MVQSFLFDKAEKKGIEKGLEKHAKIIAEMQSIAWEKHVLELKLQTILEEGHDEKLELEAKSHEQACESARKMPAKGIVKEEVSDILGLFHRRIPEDSA